MGSSDMGSSDTFNQSNESFDEPGAPTRLKFTASCTLPFFASRLQESYSKLLREIIGDGVVDDPETSEASPELYAAATANESIFEDFCVGNPASAAALALAWLATPAVKGLLLPALSVDEEDQPEEDTATVAFAVVGLDAIVFEQAEETSVKGAGGASVDTSASPAQGHEKERVMQATLRGWCLPTARSTTEKGNYMFWTYKTKRSRHACCM